MSVHALTFADFLNRLVLLDVEVKRNAPFDRGRVWMFGKKGGSFPFTKGPIYTTKDRPDDEIVPWVFIEKVLKHLGLDRDERASFWNIKHHAPSPPSPNSPTQDQA